jgi:adenosine deaminase/aminodeoxyfutalosine deaminase
MDPFHAPGVAVGKQRNGGCLRQQRPDNVTRLASMRAEERKRVSMVAACQCFEFAGFHAAIMAGMTDWLRRLPKAELHVHLEGSLTPETLCEIAPALSPESVRARYRYPDFAGFLKAYAWVNGFLKGPADFAHAAKRLFEAQEAEGVRYAEVNLSVGVMVWREMDPRPVIEAAIEQGAKAPFPVRWIFDAVRQFPIEHGWQVARLAAEYRPHGVAGFGIGGDERRGPAGLFFEIFAFALENGLKLAPHAGESDGPASVWESLRLGASRIGHGISSIEDPELVAHLARTRTPLEISLSSNVATGLVPSVELHPAKRLHDAGVPIVLNTDDPPMFGATLVGEYMLAAERLGFSREELAGIARNGFEYAFDQEAAKRAAAS